MAGRLNLTRAAVALGRAIERPSALVDLCVQLLPATVREVTVLARRLTRAGYPDGAALVRRFRRAGDIRAARRLLRLNIERRKRRA